MMLLLVVKHPTTSLEHERSEASHQGRTNTDALERSSTGRSSLSRLTGHGSLSTGRHSTGRRGRHGGVTSVVALVLGDLALGALHLVVALRQALAGLDGGVVALARRVLGDGARLVDADGLELLAVAGDGLGGRRAAHVEEAVERHADALDVRVGDAEGLRGQRDLLDEVAHLGRVEVHELVHLVHGGVAAVGGEAGHGVHGAAEEGAEELVEVGEEEAGRVSVHIM